MDSARECASACASGAQPATCVRPRLDEFLALQDRVESLHKGSCEVREQMVSQMEERMQSYCGLLYDELTQTLSQLVQEQVEEILQQRAPTAPSKGDFNKQSAPPLETGEGHSESEAVTVSSGKASGMSPNQHETSTDASQEENAHRPARGSKRVDKAMPNLAHDLRVAGGQMKRYSSDESEPYPVGMGRPSIHTTTSSACTITNLASPDDLDDRLCHLEVLVGTMLGEDKPVCDEVVARQDVRKLTHSDVRSMWSLLLSLQAQHKALALKVRELEEARLVVPDPLTNNGHMAEQVAQMEQTTSLAQDIVTRPALNMIALPAGCRTGSFHLEQAHLTPPTSRGGEQFATGQPQRTCHPGRQPAQHPTAPYGSSWDYISAIANSGAPSQFSLPSSAVTSPTNARRTVQTAQPVRISSPVLRAVDTTKRPVPTAPIVYAPRRPEGVQSYEPPPSPHLRPGNSIPTRFGGSMALPMGTSRDSLSPQNLSVPGTPPPPRSRSIDPFRLIPGPNLTPIATASPTHSPKRMA